MGFWEAQEKLELERAQMYNLIWPTSYCTPNRPQAVQPITGN